VGEAKDGRGTGTKLRILKEAANLYFAGGYENISMQILADRLLMSKTAIFHHFKNKQELFFEMLLHLIGRLHTALEDILSQKHLSTQDRLFHVLWQTTMEPSLDITRFQEEIRTYLSPEQQERIVAAWRADLFMIVQRVLEEGIERGDLRPHHTAFATYMFLHLRSLIPYTGGPTLLGTEQMPRYEFINNTLEGFLYGLARK
jgi:AcrR family transcriptional regulator